MSHPDGLPDLFLDRSLGRIVVPRLLRANGLRLVTLAEHYGVPADEDVADDEWLELAGSRAWAVLMKDARIRYNRAERDAVTAHRGPVFLPHTPGPVRSRDGRSVPGEHGGHRPGCADAGPFVYAVHRDRIERLPIGARSP